MVGRVNGKYRTPVGKISTEEPPAPAPCTIDYDLSLFRVFDTETTKKLKKNSPTRPHNYITVTACGKITIGIPDFAADDTISFLINPKGTILAARRSDKGFPVRRQMKSAGRFINNNAIRNAIKELGIKFPARYIGEYHEKRQAWIGKLQVTEETPKAKGGNKS